VERKLLRGSEVVALTPKAFDTLCVLVRNSGHLVEKEELIRVLWPDSFVEEGSLTNNIFLLRKALGEDVAYIETVPRRGYRFVGAVRQMPHVVEEETSPQEPPTHAGASHTASPASRQSGSRIPAFIGMIVVVGLTLVVLLLGNRHRAQSADIGGPSLPPKVVPLISLPGEERMPAFSPDGSRIAFVWSAPDTNRSGIYAVVVGSQSLLRLTNNVNDYCPVWSPDGRFVAFLRESAGKVLVEEIASFGGAERTIHSGMTNLLSQGYKQGSGLPFPSDGKLAFTELNPATQIDSIRVLSAEDSGSRFVTSPPVNFVDRFPVFSPDGRGLAFVRFFRSHLC
jgi:DNA-binding winged helix-turn-helix (wHTH) protein